MRHTYRGWMTVLLIGLFAFGSLVTVNDVSAQSTVTVNFLHGWDRERTDLMDEIIARFEANYPWITVDHQAINPNDLNEQLSVRVAGGLPPDLTMVSFGSSINFGLQQALMPLADFVAKDDLVLDTIFYPPVVSALVNNPVVGEGNFYYLPQLVDTNWYLFYNKAHFAEAGLDENVPPETWSQLEVMARQLNRPNAEGGWSQIGVDVVQTTYNQLYEQWLDAAGGTMYSDDLRRVALGDRDNEGMATLEWIERFTNEINGGIERQEDVNRWARSGFYQDQMSMLLNGAWSYFQIKENAPNMDIGVGPIPHRDGFDYRPSMSLGWGYGIPTNARQPEAAWLLLKFLTMELDGGGYFMLKQGRPGAAIAMNLQPEYAEENPSWHTIQSSFNRSIPAQFSPSLSGTGTMPRDMVTAVVRGTLSPSAAMNRLITLWQARLDDFWRDMP